MTTAHHIPHFDTATIVITGGTSGVGLATAKAFAKGGATKIALVGRNKERGAAACVSVSAVSPACETIFISADVNTPSGAEAVAAEVRERFGPADILVSSTVGKAVPTLFHNLDIGRIATDLNELVMGPLLINRAFIAHMREKGGGVIVNVASDAAKAPTPGESVIGAGMAGIVMFTRTLAMEAKRNGIRVNAVTPSLIEGTMTYDRVFESEFSSKLFEKAAKMASLGVVQPEDLAATIVFLASPAAARLTGQAISVNGGISAA
jgi:2-hydroxycyclohexanecarboxyl-CoA dehydrogenase